MKSLWIVTVCALLAAYGNEPIHRQTQPSVGQVSEYDLSIKILPDRHRLEVIGTWRLPPAPAARNEIEFYLDLFRRNGRFIVGKVVKFVYF